MENNTNEPETVEELELDLEEDNDTDESTDWKAKHKELVEKTIRTRERNKSLKDNLKALQAEVEELKKAKPGVPPKEEPKADESKLLDKLERLSLRTAGIDHPDDIELARKTAQKWNVDIDEVLADEDFKAKLDKQQTARANTEATSGIRGGGGSSQAKSTPEYWLAKGVPPTPADIGDRKTRAKIVRAFIEKASSNGKTFYND